MRHASVDRYLFGSRRPFAAVRNATHAAITSPSSVASAADTRAIADAWPTADWKTCPDSMRQTAIPAVADSAVKPAVIAPCSAMRFTGRGAAAAAHRRSLGRSLVAPRSERRRPPRRPIANTHHAVAAAQTTTSSTMSVITLARSGQSATTATAARTVSSTTVSASAAVRQSGIRRRNGGRIDPSAWTQRIGLNAGGSQRMNVPRFRGWTDARAGCAVVYTLLYRRSGQPGSASKRQSLPGPSWRYP